METNAGQTRPKLFVDTNICVNVANGAIAPDEWKRVSLHIRTHYLYQISFITVKELFVKLARGLDEHFEMNKKPLQVLCELSPAEFLPYPAVFALRTVLGLTSAARRAPLPEEELTRIVCKAILEAHTSSKARLKHGVPYPDNPNGFLTFDLDHFDQHENKPQKRHVSLVQGMQQERVEMPDATRLAELMLQDCGQETNADSCKKLAGATTAAYAFSCNLARMSRNKNSPARFEKRETDWGDIMQLYYLCDESMHFLTCDKKCKNQTQGSSQQSRIILFEDLIRSI